MLRVRTYCEAVTRAVSKGIAKMWRRDGMKGRVAASTFDRWLASDLWPAEATNAELLQFALGR